IFGMRELEELPMAAKLRRPGGPGGEGAGVANARPDLRPGLAGSCVVRPDEIDPASGVAETRRWHQTSIEGRLSRRRQSLCRIRRTFYNALRSCRSAAYRDWIMIASQRLRLSIRLWGSFCIAVAAALSAVACFSLAATLALAQPRDRYTDARNRM